MKNKLFAATSILTRVGHHQVARDWHVPIPGTARDSRADLPIESLNDGIASCAAGTHDAGVKNVPLQVAAVAPGADRSRAVLDSDTSSERP